MIITVMQALQSIGGVICVKFKTSIKKVEGMTHYMAGSYPLYELQSELEAEASFVSFVWVLVTCHIEPEHLGLSGSTVSRCMGHGIDSIWEELEKHDLNAGH